MNSYLVKPAKIKVVLLLQDLLFGGTQRQTLELARRLNPERYEVEIWLLMAGDDLTPVARSYGLPLTWLSRRPQVGPESLMNLWRRLARTTVDLLMLLTVVPNIWGRIFGRLTRVPVIVGNCRGGGAPRRQHERWLWPLADRIITNAAALQEVLAQHCRVPTGRITVIPNGVDLEYFRPPDEAGRGNPPKILSVARLVPDKDHDTLIRAFALAAAQYPEAELWLVGDGPLLPSLQRLAAETAPLGKVRFFPGQIDLQPFFRRADVFVLSSIYEAMPNVVLEAMAAGLPVVATRVGGLAELVTPGENGWLVPPQDPAALAAALTKLLSETETRQRFGHAGRRRVAQGFSLEVMVQRHEAVFQELTDRN